MRNSSSILLLALLLNSGLSYGQETFVPIDHKGQKVDNSASFFEEHGQTALTNGDPAHDVLYASYGKYLHLFLRKQNTLSFVTYQPLPLQAYRRWDVQLTGELVDHLASATPIEDVSWTHNYYLPTCPNGATNVHGYRRIVYKAVYPNIDMHVYSNAFGYKFYFVVRPGGDPGNILLSFQGTDSLKVDQYGALKGYLGEAQFRFPHAIAYQQVNEETTLLPWAINYHEAQNDHLVNFTFGEFDHEQPLIIDISEDFGPQGEMRDSPIPEWGSYYGGGDLEEVSRMCEVSAGGIAACGKTYSSNFPENVGSTFIGTPGNSDAYFTYFDNNYHRVVSTFFGGDSDDEFQGIAFGFNQHFVMAGYTTSDPITMSWGPSSAFNDDTKGVTATCVMIAEFDIGGVRQWSTLYGHDQSFSSFSSVRERPVANVALDHLGNLVLAGNISYFSGVGFPSIETVATNQPTDGSMPIWGTGYSQAYMPYANFLNEGPLPTYTDGWIAKFNPARQLTYSTLFGGSAAYESINDMAIDQVTDHVYIVGSTTSPRSLGCTQPPIGIWGFPWCAFPGGYNQLADIESGLWHDAREVAFFASFNALNELVWCTPFAGPGPIGGTEALALDIPKIGTLSKVNIVGITKDLVYNTTACAVPTNGFPICNSAGYPFTFPFVPNNENTNGFIVRVDALTKTLLWSSSLGACIPTDVMGDGNKIFVSANRYAFGVGDQPLLDAPDYYTDLEPASVGDGLVLGFDGDLFYGSLFGGNGEEEITNIVKGPLGRVYICGRTNSSALFPLNDPLPGVSWYVDQLQPGGDDLFYAQLKLVLLPVGVNEVSDGEQEGLLVFPDPASHALSIRCAGPACDNARYVRIYNALGQVVVLLPWKSDGPSLDVSQLSAGTYQLELLDPQSKMLLHQSFIKVP